MPTSQFDPSRTLQRFTAWTALGLALTLLCSSVSAQRQLHHLERGTPRDFFGFALCGAGDVNGDGFDDLLVGASRATAPFAGPGDAIWYSGLDGSLIRTITGPPGNTTFGGSLSRAGDVNADGFEDFIIGDIVGQQNRGAAHVISGANFTFLYNFSGDASNQEFGAAVSNAGDVNADGFDDVIVGSPRHGAINHGLARVFSGLDGSILYSLTGTLLSSFGTSVCSAGDYNGDGFDDVFVGARFDDAAANAAGAAYVFSGANGSVLASFFGGPVFGTSFGTHVANAGDVSGNGLDDLLVASISSVFVFEGGSGAMLFEFAQDLQEGFPGLPCDGAGDVNGDGFADVIVGTPRKGDGFNLVGGAHVYSGFDGALLYALEGSDLSFFGYSVAGAGDVNGDGLDDVIVGSLPYHPIPGETAAPGFARVFAGGPTPATFDDLCNGDGGDQLGCTDCPCGNNAVQNTIGGCLNNSGSSARLHATGDVSASLNPGLTTDLRFSITGARPNTLCLLRSGRIIPPGSNAHPCFGLNSGTRSTQFNGLRCIGQGRELHGARVADSNGDVGFTNDPWGGEAAPTPGIAALKGFQAGYVRYFQCWYRDVPGMSCLRSQNTSQAIAVVFQP